MRSIVESSILPLYNQPATESRGEQTMGEMSSKLIVIAALVLFGLFNSTRNLTGWKIDAPSPDPCVSSAHVGCYFSIPGKEEVNVTFSANFADEGLLLWVAIAVVVLVVGVIGVVGLCIWKGVCRISVGMAPTEEDEDSVGMAPTEEDEDEG